MKLKTLTIFFLSLGMFVACGKFKPMSSTNLQQLDQSLDQKKDQIPQANATPSELEQLEVKYAHLLSAETSAAAKIGVRALDISLRELTDANNASTGTYRVSARIYSDCNNVATIQKDGVSAQPLVGLQGVEIGSAYLRDVTTGLYKDYQSQYTLNFQCLDANCDRAVAIITDNNVNGSFLTMMENKNRSGDFIGTQAGEGRAFYKVLHSTGTFLQACSEINAYDGKFQDGNRINNQDYSFLSQGPTSTTNNFNNQDYSFLSNTQNTGTTTTTTNTSSCVQFPFLSHCAPTTTTTNTGSTTTTTNTSSCAQFPFLSHCAPTATTTTTTGNPHR